LRQRSGERITCNNQHPDATAVGMFFFLRSKFL